MIGRKGDIDWTEAKIATLRQLWDEGLSLSEIGKRVKTTKNAVRGKAARLGFPKHPTVAKPLSEHPKAVWKRNARVAAIKAVRAGKTTLPGPLSVATGPLRLLEPRTDNRAEPEYVYGERHGRSDVAIVDRSRATPRPEIGAAVSASLTLYHDQRNIDAQTPSRAATFIPTLPRSACCWPLWGDERPTHEYCGTRSLPGRPYCVDHHAMAFR